MNARWQEHSDKDSEAPRVGLDSVEPSERQHSPIDLPNDDCSETNHDSTNTKNPLYEHLPTASTTAENQRSSSREGSQVQESKEAEVQKEEREAAAFLAREKAERQAAEEEMAGRAQPDCSCLGLREASTDDEGGGMWCCRRRKFGMGRGEHKAARPWQQRKVAWTGGISWLSASLFVLMGPIWLLQAAVRLLSVIERRSS